MRSLTRHERVLRAYVDGVESFPAVESAVRDEIRVYAARRAARWSTCPALAADLAQVLLVTLWRELDALDAVTVDSVSAWCGARMEYSLRRALRAHRRVVDVQASYAVFEDDDGEPLDGVLVSGGYEMSDVLALLRGVKDDGVRAYALAALDVDFEHDIVARVADVVGLVERLGWSDAAMGCRAARKRAQRNVTLRESIGGA